MKTIHGKNVNDFCERTGKKKQKTKKTFETSSFRNWEHTDWDLDSGV